MAVAFEAMLPQQRQNLPAEVDRRGEGGKDNEWGEVHGDDPESCGKSIVAIVPLPYRRVTLPITMASRSFTSGPFDQGRAID